MKIMFTMVFKMYTYLVTHCSTFKTCYNNSLPSVYNRSVSRAVCYTRGRATLQTEMTIVMSDALLSFEVPNVVCILTSDHLFLYLLKLW